jgi:probable phosphoglycerate mutase
VTQIALLRHGPTEWNALGKVQGHTDIPLNAKGLARMRSLMPPSPFDRAKAYASPLLRARQTAEALGLADPVLDARLMEQHWGRWEGLSRADILARDGADAFRSAGSAGAFRPPGGESTGELHARVAAFLKDAAGKSENAIVVAHLGVLRAAYTLATGWDMATPMPEGLDVGKLLILDLAADGTPSLQALNVDFRPRTA